MRSAANTASTANPAPPTPAWKIGLPLFACILLGWWVHRRVLGGFFAPDDFIYLERAAGLRHDPWSMWRVLSGRLYFDAVAHRFAGVPARYFACNLLLHSVGVALLYAAIRRWGGSAAAAMLGAGLFAASPLAYTTLAQAATVSELLMTVFTLGALILAGERGRVRALVAILLFVAALLSKESVVLLPLVLLITPAGDPRRRIGLALGMCGIGLLWSVAIAITSMGGAYSGGAYESRFGIGIFHNLMTFADWSTDLGTPVPDLFGTFSTTAWKSGLIVLASWVAIAVGSWRRNRLAAAGLAWWFLGLAPVLPLLYHSFLHYLYLPIAGMAMAAAGAFDWLRSWAQAGSGSGWRRRGSRPRPEHAGAGTATVHRAGLLSWSVVALLLGAHARAADRLLAARGEAQVAFMRLPVDPFLRKTLLAERSVRGLAAQLDGEHVRVGIMLPRGPAKGYGVLTRDLMDQGRALRLLVPAADTVAYVERWTPAAGGLELFAQSSEGDVLRLGPGARGFRSWIDLLRRNGFGREAEEWIAEARRNDPSDAVLADTLVRLEADRTQAGVPLGPESVPDSVSVPLRFDVGEPPR